MTDVSVQQWGEVGGVDLWVLQSTQVRVEVLSLGSILRSVCCRGREGHMEDVVLGFDQLEGYLSDQRYLGATVGRVANRIARGRFVVEGEEYRLDINNGPNALHGGLRGFNKAIWLATAVEGGVQLSLTSPDGDQGYPGEVQVSVCYTLQGETLTAEYHARSTKTTPINLTNHSYFNLAGQAAADIYDHQVSISAQSYLPVDDSSIPTGEIRQVKGTPFDLTTPVLIGPRLKEVPGPGFDHNFCLSFPGDSWTERDAARVCHPASGRVLEVSTSQPGVQFYTANFLDGLTGKGGVRYRKHSAFCLETQNWPDAVNQDNDEDSHRISPSPVVHVRGLCEAVVEADLIDALEKFGSICYVMMMPFKRQALVEFSAVESADRCVSCGAKEPVYIAGQQAYFNYSTSKRITRPTNADNPNSGNKVLLLSIQNPLYPITTDVLYTVCNPIGSVLRIVIFKRNGIQAMVEFESVQCAQKAKAALNGADIYAGCCTLKIEYARPTRLNVITNDNESWDYTKPYLVRRVLQILRHERSLTLSSVSWHRSLPPFTLHQEIRMSDIQYDLTLIRQSTGLQFLSNAVRDDMMDSN
ncbi:galactose mutarotase [Pseudochaenichthys georgianus]|uniref:galactose mutarotase n=1 Tax=Pseudochaenichthys georgianus TaxID=52239 RepID=UPI00146B2BFB|nr:aldose 1-epimerase [Pseudochaenichthys georgianus]